MFMKKMNLLIGFFLILGVCTVLFFEKPGSARARLISTHDRIIQGQVISEYGPVENARVRVAGTETFVLTDRQGNFKLSTKSLTGNISFYIRFSLTTSRTIVLFLRSPVPDATSNSLDTGISPKWPTPHPIQKFLIYIMEEMPSRIKMSLRDIVSTIRTKRATALPVTRLQWQPPGHGPRIWKQHSGPLEPNGTELVVIFVIK